MDTNVKLRSVTRDRLRAAKEGAETYDDVITRLLEETEEPFTRASELASRGVVE